MGSGYCCQGTRARNLLRTGDFIDTPLAYLGVAMGILRLGCFSDSAAMRLTGVLREIEGTTWWHTGIPKLAAFAMQKLQDKKVVVNPPVA